MQTNSEMQGNSLVNVSYLKNDYQVEIYENNICLVNNTDTALHGNPDPSKRSAIKEFSSASRRRLLRMFARLKHSQLSVPIFITLTYHNRCFDQGHDPKKDLNTFLQYLRDNYPSLKYIWRLEVQKRGAVHYHLILWSFPGDDICSDRFFLIDLSDTWHRIADAASEDHRLYGFFAEPLTSFRKAFSYLSKYVAKEDHREKFPDLGRRWGCSTNLPIGPMELVNIPKDVFFQLKRLSRKLLKSKSKLSRNMRRIMGFRSSVSFFLARSSFLKLFNYVSDVYLNSNLYPWQKDLFLKELATFDDPTIVDDFQ